MSIELRRAPTGAMVILFLLAAGPLRGQEACPPLPPPSGDGDAALAHVRYLADDALEGREVATAGARCAAAYLVQRLQEAGLRPGGAEGSWFHGFPVRTGARPGPDDALEISGEAREAGKAWTPLGFSAAGEVRAPLVYAGHLLSRPGDPSDTWAHTDVRDRIVVVEWGDPDQPDGRGLRAGTHFKATVAAGRGAAGVLVLLPEGRPLPDLTTETRASLGVLGGAVSAEAAEAVRAAARAGEEARLSVTVEPAFSEARNVVALLPGSDPARSGELVVVGAHYDHLGWGGEGSLDPDRRAVHNGADDNASGTAALLEIARELAARGPFPRPVLFVAFTGEEKGLWGSARFVAEPPLPLEDAVAMLNLDMVGRLGEGPLTVFGVGTAAEWEELLRRANGDLPGPVPLALSPDGYGPSDHASFHGAGIPVLHFFTNTHAEYHRPEDDWELIDGPGLARVTELAAGVARRLAGEGGAPAELTPTAAAARGAPAREEEGRGYGPYLGTIPDMVPREEPGLRLSGVREGSPAERAGLRAGDVVVSFGGREVADIYGYTYALRDHSPGDAVAIVVIRDGARVTVRAVLGEPR